MKALKPPKYKLKRKAEQAGQLSVEARKKQRLTSESAESIAAAVERTPPLSAHETVSSQVSSETVSSQVSSAIEAPPSISAQTITTFSSTAGPSFVRETEETGGMGEATEVEESVGGDGAFGDGEETDSGTSAGNTTTTSKPSQEMMGKFVDEWLQVLDTEEMMSVAMLLCYHLVGMFSFTETKAAEYALLPC